MSTQLTPHVYLPLEQNMTEHYFPPMNLAELQDIGTFRVLFSVVYCGKQTMPSLLNVN